jgi:hypothetical protein
MNQSLDLGMVTNRDCRLQPDTTLNCRLQQDTVLKPVTPNLNLQDFNNSQTIQLMTTKGN